MEWAQRIGERIAHLSLEALRAPFRADERLHVVYLLSAALLAAGVFFERERRRGGRFSVRGFLSYAFPKEVYLHRSARIDYVFLVLDRVLFPLLVAPLVIGSTVSFLAVRDVLNANFDGGALAGAPVLAFVVMTALSLLALDIGLFLSHYLQHRVPLLWEFHKVHHSAKVLTPFTVYRMHPMDNLLSFTLAGALIGVAEGIVSHFTLGAISVEKVASLNIGVFLFYLVGFNLRHSHIWLHYGSTVSRFLISPAQHQIHHSSEARHFDKNLGFMLAVWDRLAGTLYVPQEDEKLSFGLPDGEDEAFSSVWALYARPFVEAVRLLRKSLPLQLVLLLTLSGILFVWVGSTYGWLGATTADDVAEQSVWMADLTADELGARIESGWDTVIVPTGGTEQNGPHMILGKHHRIVEHASERIAKALGKTMVAPVVDYVPEGDIDPPSGHMQWTGTLSIPEPVFASMLESIVASLRHHGFRTICLVGDSGDSQQAQKQVAQKLDSMWHTQGIRVVHVGEYYDLAPQLQLLREEGESESTIGRHAGIRDTSELLAVYPDGVRADKIDVDGGRANSGVDGDPRRASPKRGAKLLELKIQSAVEAIERARQSR